VLFTQQHPDLFNQYGVILVNPEKCKSGNYKAARKLQDWLLSEAGQKAIAAYRKLDTQLFFPNAAR
jgi:tungstate transport system substrate-binding protein